MGRKQRQEDYFTSFNAAINYAERIEADAVVHTGNLFWSKSPRTEVIERCRERLKALANSDTDFYLLYGERDLKVRDLLDDFEQSGLLERLSARWNLVGDVAILANDATEDDPTVGYISPPDDAVTRFAALYDDLETATEFSNIRTFQNEVGWSVDALLLGNQDNPVQTEREGVAVVSPGPPEHIIGKSDIDQESPPPRYVFRYDVAPDSIEITPRKIHTRPVAGFRLELTSDQTASDIRGELPVDQLDGAAAILEVIGHRGPDSPSKDKVQSVVEEYAAFARVYDERTSVTANSDKSEQSQTGRMPSPVVTGLGATQPAQTGADVVSGGETATSQSKKSELEEQKSVSDIPGVGKQRAESLLGAGVCSISEVAESPLSNLRVGDSIGPDVAKQIRLAAREMCQYEGTPIKEIADEFDVDRPSLSDGYLDISTHPAGSTEEKVEAIRATVSDDESVMLMDTPSTFIRYSLYISGYRTPSSVAEASTSELTEVSYVTEETAEEARSAAKSILAHSEDSEIEASKVQSEPQRHASGVSDGRSETVPETHLVDSQTTRSPRFLRTELDKLDSGQNSSLDGTAIEKTLTEIKTALQSRLGGLEWFERFDWNNSFKTPYIGPENPGESSHVWLGLVDQKFDSLARASHSLQIEFGVDRSSRSAFYRRVIWGLFLGPWAPEGVTETIARNIQDHSSVLAQFLTDHDEYILVTRSGRLDSPTRTEIEAIASELDGGIVLTRNLEHADLVEIDLLNAAYQTLHQLIPIYWLLSDINDPPPLTRPNESDLTTEEDNTRHVMQWDEESLSAASTLSTQDVNESVELLRSNEYEKYEALALVQQYVKSMLECDGLFAIKGVGPYTGGELVTAGITDISDLQAVDTTEVSQKTDLSESKLKQIRDAARDNDKTSLDPGDPKLASRLTDSEPAQLAGNDSNEPQDGFMEETDKGRESPTETAVDLREVPSPEELSPPIQDPVTLADGTNVHPNYLTEYYESISSVQEVLEIVFQLEGTDIEPNNLSDPRVQYYLLIDACIEFGQVSNPFTGYGPQQNNRIDFTVDDYRKAFGDGETITDYQVINVERFSEQSREVIRQVPGVSPDKFVRPCLPGTTIPLPELPGSFEDLETAMQFLSQLPAYPPLQFEIGMSEQTIPIDGIYREYFGDLDPESTVDLSSLSSGQAPPIEGEVVKATPKSDAEAASKLVDYGKLSHYFRRVNAPSDSPADRNLGVLALEQYRPRSSSFETLQGLAKHGDEDAVEHFRPRVQDLIHRRFLHDSWKYDYITIYPGHEAGSLDPLLVNLARDGVVETDIIYTPLLERTETVARQREKSKEERQEVAITPSDSLRVRSNLNGESILLFDDICTTGSSLIAGSHLLLEAGAKRVVGVTLGMTPGGMRDKITEITEPRAVVSEVIAGGGR